MSATALQPPGLDSSDPRMQPLQNEVSSIEGGIDDDCRVSFKCENKFFDILIPVDSPTGSVEHTYLNRLKSPLQSGDEESAEQMFDELINFLAGLCQPIFRKFVNVSSTYPPGRQTLLAQLYPEVIGLRLITLDGTATLRIEYGPRMSIPAGFHDGGLRLPILKPSRIEILETLSGNTVFKALVEGTTVCAKVTGQGRSTKSVQREINSLQQILASEPQLHTPNILGLISFEEDSSQIVGFVMECVSPSASTQELSCIEIDTVPQARRDAWGRQISNDLARLHALGLVWGDAKPGNIIIDENKTPWIVDFGGSFTMGWVDAHLADTISGDMQGLQRILEFLRISPPKQDQV